MDPTTPPNIKAILTEMATLTTMERGTLSEEYRTRPASDGSGSIRLGPYYKLQVWEHGRNASRRVPAPQVPALQQDLANHERFTELADSFVEETIALTRRQRGTGTGAEDTATAKKNSAKKQKANAVRKPKPSSRKPKPG